MQLTNILFSLALLAVLAGAGHSQKLTAEATRPPDLRVHAQLNNGHSIIGVALGSRLSEKSTRRGYSPTEDRKHRKSGVRVWYYRNLDGFIFLPHKTVEKLEVLGKLSSADSRALRTAVSAARKARASAAKAKAEAAKAKAKPGGEPGEKPGEGGGDVLTSAEQALLKEFPPDKGWSAERFGEIQRRKIVLHINPSSQEQKFIEVFQDWAKAHKKWQRMKDAPAKPTPPTEKPGNKPSDAPKKKGLGLQFG